ncbi:3-keto-disaccharide hydrolase [Larkinella punicea]|uniref:DUF1080 domain-containing protein n=1 Tax=Larkinella punicea TaxID=2315727 RepID=A0A368JVV1_9BACT|nr:DUF1080 domain-containing protein [Larkinella punicea]RCR70713.1 DUF1080 domain-containing protein [Larkinella punicea]
MNGITLKLMMVGIGLSSLTLAQPANTLSPAEKKAGWQLLFDGKTTTGWRGAYADRFPAKGWVVKDGELRGELQDGAESGDAGDIVTLKKYRHFELVFEWKLGKGDNSGVKYFIEERLPKPAIGSQAGYEYQLIDDTDYIYNGKKLPQDLKTASIYDVVAATKPDVKMDVWHRSRIVVNNNQIEHWLDGVKVLTTNRTTDAFRQGVADSKFNSYAGFADIPEGHILLQDHGHSVAFRTIKIKPLP